MSFRIGLVGLCTSHPEAWVPEIRELVAKGLFDAEVTACWDSGECRRPTFAKEFAEKFQIPHAVEKPEEMMDLVDGVIVHTTNWDRHIEQARLFVEAGKTVFIDKPMAGNLRDIAQIQDWLQRGKRVFGGSVMRFCYEVRDYLAIPVEERGEITCAYSAAGVDEYNYGIHAYATVIALLGKGVSSARWISGTRQKNLALEWTNGKTALLTVGDAKWLPFNVTACSDRKFQQIAIDNMKVYRAMLEAVMPWFCDTTGKLPPPLAADELLEPELAAIAARRSWQRNGERVLISDLRMDDDGYDGYAFARGYRRARLQADGTL